MAIRGPAWPCPFRAARWLREQEEREGRAQAEREPEAMRDREAPAFRAVSPWVRQAREARAARGESRDSAGRRGREGWEIRAVATARGRAPGLAVRGAVDSASPTRRARRGLG